jgi:hypothetical protein
VTRKRSSSTRGEAGTPEALAYTNRKGVTYYLHEGRTKSGKPRYFFARSVGDGSLVELPSGYEVVESINGVVSVRLRREGEIAIPDDDLALVRAALERHAHLRHHVVLADRDAIVIHQPDVDLAALQNVALSFGRLPGRAETTILADRIRRAHFSPVLRFVRDGSTYVAHRMTYRGDGGWSHPLAWGPLDRLVPELVPKVGTEDFFELM